MLIKEVNRRDKGTLVDSEVVESDHYVCLEGLNYGYLRVRFDKRVEPFSWMLQEKCHKNRDVPSTVKE